MFGTQCWAQEGNQARQPVEVDLDSHRKIETKDPNPKRVIQRNTI